MDIQWNMPHIYQLSVLVNFAPICIYIFLPSFSILERTDNSRNQTSFRCIWWKSNLLDYIRKRALILASAANFTLVQRTLSNLLCKRRRAKNLHYNQQKTLKNADFPKKFPRFLFRMKEIEFFRNDLRKKLN